MSSDFGMAIHFLFIFSTIMICFSFFLRKELHRSTVSNCEILGNKILDVNLVTVKCNKPHWPSINKVLVMFRVQLLDNPVTTGLLVFHAVKYL